ncbi:MAG: DUF2244 domain-containing protein [Rhodospirillales bacterium]|nr:MAG: DUF2244 domain-containing protein [Rhodospirillales bacterium]
MSVGQRVSGPVVFSAVLRPHRSAGASANRTVLMIAGGFLFAVGCAFVAAGAWPIAPFLGLELLLLALAFRLNQRAGRAFEAINLTPQALTVSRVDHWGKRTDHAFPPHWLQVNLDEPPERHTPLELRSHGRSLVIGSFLLPDERLRIARTLRRELGRVTTAAGRSRGEGC